MQRARLPYLLIPIAAFLAIIPLLINGCSCGHDFDFHIVSWFEAARQFTHGNLHPHWAYTPAWNAGEPRFVFYPPLSWTVGAILGLIVPWAWTPILYTWLALTAAGLSLYYLARDFTTPAAATLAAILYTVNPYMLFTAYERSAYAELLAAAFIPLLLHAILRQRVTIPRIAIPIALLWLTNAPAAVMSCYALALLTLIRLATHPVIPSLKQGAPRLDSEMGASREYATTATFQTRLQLALNTLAGTALGLGLAAFYILPAAYERRYVQIAMAILPTMRFQDNFLFGHTADIDHDHVLHTASLIALIFVILTAAALITARITQKARVSHSSQPYRESGSPTSAFARRGGEAGEVNIQPSPLALTLLTIAITLLLTPLTKFIWTHAPELAFLQFPWRLLAILAAVLALTIAITLTPLKIKPAITTVLTLLIAAALTYPAYKIFRQTCDPEDTVQNRLAVFHSSQGTDPTDEYTPTTADNDRIAHGNPPYWLTLDPNAKAPANVQPGPAPTHFSFRATEPGFLILNLRDYPSWDVTSTHSNSMALDRPNHIRRNDGLIALPLYYAADYKMEIDYVQPVDQTLGDILSLVSLVLLAFLPRLQRETRVHLPVA